MSFRIEPGVEPATTIDPAQFIRMAFEGAPLAPLIAERPSLASVSDYMPPVTTTPGALTADAENNLWIRTSTMIDGRPVYDVVNRRGELFDRVQLPAFRTIAGFGSGVIYMAMKDSTGVVHLERARVR